MKILQKKSIFSFFGKYDVLKGNKDATYPYTGYLLYGETAQRHNEWRNPRSDKASGELNFFSL